MGSYLQDLLEFLGGLDGDRRSDDGMKLLEEKHIVYCLSVC